MLKMYTRQDFNGMYLILRCILSSQSTICLYVGLWLLLAIPVLIVCNQISMETQQGYDLSKK